MLNLQEFVNTKKNFVVAHRGSSGTAPENTIAAFNEALNAGADMIEIDIQFSSDGHIVVFHDKWLSRTTDGSGITTETELSKLMEFDAGSWFDKKYSDQRIPSLSEVLKLLRDRVYLNIEIKNLKSYNNLSALEKIINNVNEAGFNGKVLYSSFFYDSLLALKKIDGSIPTAAIRIPKDIRLPSEIATNYHCQAFVCSLSEINPEINADIKENGLYLGLYSIDTKEDLDKAIIYSPKAIVTNYPARIIKFLNEQEKS